MSVIRQPKMRLIFLLSLLIAAPVAAHDGVASPDDVWTHWNTNPLLLTSLLLPLGLFMRGAENYPIGQWRKAAFIAGILVIMLALISPLDSLSAALFSAHMVQHLLLILLAAPLLILSRPTAPILRALPRAWAKSFAWLFTNSLLQTILQQLSKLGVAVFLHLAALALWHLPALYGLGLLNSFAHVLEHASFFLTAMLFWWAIYQPKDYGFRILAIFVVMMASGLLGALMSFTKTAWYPEHAAFTPAWGLSPLEDQQLAGLFMWIPPSLVYVLAAALLLAAWIGSVEETMQKRKRILAKEASDA
jgi:putative membrane protein